jgi:hypothetical protein
LCIPVLAENAILAGGEKMEFSVVELWSGSRVSGGVDGTGNDWTNETQGVAITIEFCKTAHRVGLARREKREMLA